ncbi:hypothetical protein, partial [Dongia sedimenti]|nr:hypothetical protein [Rhodospirillaceae bacterium R-7]
SACIAFTTSKAIGKLVIVAACCGMGVLLLCAWQFTSGVPLPCPDTESFTSPALPPRRTSGVDRGIIYTLFEIVNSASKVVPDDVLMGAERRDHTGASATFPQPLQNNESHAPARKR